LGPDVLPYLPRPNAKLSDSQKKALNTVRKTLRDQQIQRDLAPKLVTLDGEFTVTKALEELQKQTGTTVEDRREGSDAKLKLKLNKTTFWQALDAIAKEADGVVSYYRGDTLALERRPDNYQSPTVSYDGIFRAVGRRINSVLALDTDVPLYRAPVEVAWEPRLRPFRLEVSQSDLTVKDDKGTKLDLGEGEKETLAVTHSLFVRFEVPLGSVQRESRKLGLLKGSLKFIGPTRME